MDDGPARLESVVDEDDCLNWLWGRFSTDGTHAMCPSCETDRSFQRIGRQWRCQHCGTAIDVTATTIFARSSVPLLTWFHAIAAVRETPNINITTLSQLLDLAYTTTWRMYQRLTALDTSALEWRVPPPRGEPELLAPPTGTGAPGPAKSRRQPSPTVNSEERMEQILSAARRAIVKRGLNGMRIADVAHEAGVSPATVLYSYPTKEALLIAALERLYQRNEAKINEHFTTVTSAAERLAALAVYAIGVGISLDEHRMEMEFLQRAAQDKSLRHRWHHNAAEWRRIMLDTISLGVEQDEFKLKRTNEDAADTIIALWNALNVRLLLEYAWFTPERALNLGLASAADLLHIPLERLTALAESEIAIWGADLP